jgi:hypothetical protein
VQRVQGALAVLILACLGAGIGVVVVGRSPGVVSTDTGRLADLLAAHQSARVADLVVRADRRFLSSSRLQTDWDRIVAAVGPFLHTSRTINVDEGRTRHEVEVLTFARGAGTLSALRTRRGISALWLVAGASQDTDAAKRGAELSKALADGQWQTVEAAFDPTMRAALPVEGLKSATAKATGRLDGPVAVVAQLVVDHPPYTVVESYLRYRNGLRRVEIAFDSSREVAGLFIHSV